MIATPNTSKSQKRTDYYLKNREKILAYGTRYRLKNKDKVRANKARYYAEKKEHLNAYSTAWVKANPDKNATYGAAWRKANPDKCVAVVSRYRAGKRGAAGSNYTTSKHIGARWEMYGGRCYICKSKATATDHVIPLARGGSHWPANLRPICKSCNSRKGAKPLNDILL